MRWGVRREWRKYPFRGPEGGPGKWIDAMGGKSVREALPSAPPSDCIRPVMIFGNGDMQSTLGLFVT